MDHNCFLMNSLVSRFLQDNGALLRNRATGPPISISMATRIASPSPDRLPTPSSTRRSDRGQQTESRLLRQSHRQRSSIPTGPGSRNSQPAHISRTLRQGHPLTTMTTNPNAIFRHSTPPPSEYGRFRRADQSHNSGLTFELWDNDEGALPGTGDDLDNNFLEFLETEFSSPSSYPSFTNLNQISPAAGSRSQQPPQAPGPGPESAPLPRSTAPRRQNNPSATVTAASAACIFHASAPERSETQLTTSTTNTSTTVGESQNTLFSVDDFGYDNPFDTPASSFDENMPPSLRRRPEVATPPVEPVHRAKRRRTSTNAAAPTLRKAPSSRAYATEIKIDDDDCIFEEKHARATPGREPISEDLTTIDLTEANEVPEELKKPEVDNRIKISAFQCVICMDDCTTLTVTHCGHMYCAQCLHSSLNVEATKGKCPMCRQKLELKPRETYSSKTKGYWPLELKLMTATRKGKRKANSMA